jgi:hypothetical protein
MGRIERAAILAACAGVSFNFFAVVKSNQTKKRVVLLDEGKGIPRRNLPGPARVTFS